MRKENGKRESPYKGILKFADEKKPQLSFAVVLSVLSSAFGSKQGRSKTICIGKQCNRFTSCTSLVGGPAPNPP